MRVLPVAVTAYGGSSKLNSNTYKHQSTNVSFQSQPAFKGGKSILGGFLAGVVATVAVSTVFPMAILGAGVVGIGGALLGDSVDCKKPEDKK